MPAGFRLFMPPDASVPDDLQAWLLLNPGALTRAPRGQHFLRVVGRMRDGVTLEQARREIDGIAAQISREYTDYGSRGALYNTVGLHADGVRLIRPALLALFGGVAILLLSPASTSRACWSRAQPPDSRNGGADVTRRQLRHGWCGNVSSRGCCSRRSAPQRAFRRALGPDSCSPCGRRASSGWERRASIGRCWRSPLRSRACGACCSRSRR